MVKMKLENEFNGNYHKILNWFFAFPLKKIGLTKLSEELGMAKKTVSRVVIRLIKEGFLIKEVFGKTWRISCNLNHPYHHSRRIGHNLRLVYESGVLEKIKEKIGSFQVIILFGSYRKGDDVEESDLDIGVEVLGNDDLKIVSLGKVNLGYRKNVRVNLHIFNRKKIDLNLFSNIANGIVLEGFLEVKP